MNDKLFSNKGVQSRRKEEFAVARKYQEKVEKENASLPLDAMVEAEKKDYEEYVS